MLLFLIACLELNLALFNLLLVSHRRRTILMRHIAFSRTSYRRFGSNTRLARARRFWIRPGRTSAWWDNFVSQTVVPEEWKENFRMSRPFLLKLSEELRLYIEGKWTRMRQPVDVVKRVACKRTKHVPLCPHSGFEAC